MENWFTHNATETFFLKVFFSILVGFFSLVLLSLFLFNINDSVPFTTGEILAEVPQIDVKAPYECIPKKILVKEGDAVKAGDTLMVLLNEEVRKNYRDAESAY